LVAQTSQRTNTGSFGANLEAIPDEQRRAVESELKIKKSVVGAWRFELQTSCAQGKSGNAKWLVRLAFSCVMHRGFARYSSMFVAKLSPSFEVTP
jgi:hypothetical protein